VWKASVSARCVGNSRLVLAVATAFAAPLLRLVGAQGGGWHFVGASSSGKTTAIEIAASVLGFPSASGTTRGYVRSWDATKNGLAIMAAM
jgi:putative DNA primase/helicase